MQTRLAARQAKVVATHAMVAVHMFYNHEKSDTGEVRSMFQTQLRNLKALPAHPNIHR